METFQWGGCDWKNFLPLKDVRKDFLNFLEQEFAIET